jgi:hypothetical protein
MQEDARQMDPEDDLIELASYAYANEMAMAKCALEAAGIPVVEMNENINRLDPFCRDIMSGMRLFVPKSRFDDACGVLEDGSGITDEELARQSSEFPAPEE